MAERNLEQALKQIEAALLHGPGGLSVVELQTLVPGSISRRTLSRRLSTLLETGRIQRAGQGPSTRYVLGLRRPGLAVSEGPAPEGRFDTPDGAVTIPVSDAGREILDYVSRPRAARTPRGYDRELLERYEPNRSDYLPDQLKAHLHTIGKPIVAERAAGTFARDILSRLLIDLSWASSRLEGNTYSRLDTERLIQFGQEAEGKDWKETRMILNHKSAIELLVNDTSDAIGINRFTLLNLHTLLSDGLMADAEACGRLRRRPVGIWGSAYTPTAIPQLIENCFTQIIAKAAAIADPFERAFFFMVHLPYLQPFEDVNKRVSRLAANIPLIQADLCPLSFVEVPERAYIAGTMGVYELGRMDLLRDVFVWAYERSCHKYVIVRDSVVEPDLFRMRYREALIDVIGQIVRDCVHPGQDDIRARAAPVVEPRDVPTFVEIVVNELKRLREGNVARYRIKLSEFVSWTRSRETGNETKAARP